MFHIEVHFPRNCPVMLAVLVKMYSTLIGLPVDRN